MFGFENVKDITLKTWENNIKTNYERFIIRFLGSSAVLEGWTVGTRRTTQETTTISMNTAVKKNLIPDTESYGLAYVVMVGCC